MARPLSQPGPVCLLPHNCPAPSHPPAVSLYSVVGGYYFYRMWSSGVPMLPWMYYALMAMSVVTVAFCDFQFFTAKK